MTTSAEKEKKYLMNAPPPLEAVISMSVIAGVALYTFPSVEKIDELAQPEIFTQRLFPKYVSLGALVNIRLLFALFCFGVTAKVLLSKGLEVETTYLPSSRLRESRINLIGISSQFPFTSWCWNLLGVSFAFSAYTGWLVGTGETVSPLLLRTTLILWETAAPFTLLVGAVVKFALWPMTLKSKGPDHAFKTPRALLQHNANAMMAVSEVGLLGGLPVKMGHISLAVLFGVSYVFFTWSIMYHWAPGKGPTFIYFFMDTTLGRTATIALFALLGVLMLFFSVFSGAEWLLERYGGNEIGRHIGFVIILCSLVCRWRN